MEIALFWMKPYGHGYSTATNLTAHLGWHGARVSFLALFLMARFRVKTVNLAEVATGFVGRAQTNSDDKRQRVILASV